MEHAQREYCSDGLGSWLLLIGDRTKTLLDAEASLKSDGFTVVVSSLSLGAQGSAKPTIFIKNEPALDDLVVQGIATDYKRVRGLDGTPERWFQFDRLGCRVIWIQSGH